MRDNAATFSLQSRSIGRHRAGVWISHRCVYACSCYVLALKLALSLSRSLALSLSRSLALSLSRSLALSLSRSLALSLSRSLALSLFLRSLIVLPASLPRLSACTAYPAYRYCHLSVSLAPCPSSHLRFSMGILEFLTDICTHGHGFNIQARLDQQGESSTRNSSHRRSILPSAFHVDFGTALLGWLSGER